MSTSPEPAAIEQLLVVGAGLLGTSVALAARRAGVEVHLADTDPAHVRTATSLGAGHPWEAGTPDPDLIVVAVPPSLLGAVIGEWLTACGRAVVTDVGSVKQAPLDALADHPGLSRYLGSHPMAGSERSGPLAATAELFEGRPWAITAHPAAGPQALARVEALVGLCGAVPVRLSAADHDRAVALVSHLPHLMSVVMAGRLAGAPKEYLFLSGQGVRDVTRIAGSDPVLWRQIVTANATALGGFLEQARQGIDDLLAAVRSGDGDAVEDVLRTGVAGHRAIPGKHGGLPLATAPVYVQLPDEPGALAELFAAAGATGINIEDVRIDHEPGREVGLVELSVARAHPDALIEALLSAGWVAHR